MKRKIPKSLQGVLWSVNIKNLDFEKNKGYVIHQVLNFGTMEHLKWLFTMYGKNVIRDYFKNHPSKTYYKRPYYFAKNFLLGLKNVNLDEQNHVTSFFGPLRPRAAGNIQLKKNLHSRK